MAVRLDIEAVRGVVDPQVFLAAKEMLISEDVGEIIEIGGGAAALVTGGPDSVYEAWVGVVDGEFTGECACPQAVAEPEELCQHVVAVTLVAIDEEFTWSSDATPPSATAMDPRVHALAELAARVPQDRLALLIAEYAAMDVDMETRLRGLAR